MVSSSKNNLVKTNLIFLALAILFRLFFLSKAEAAPWEDYGRTYPVRFYEQDEGHDWAFNFGVSASFDGYTDPNFEEAALLPSPLNDKRFKSYNLIIMINDNEKESRPEIYGRPQTMRVYSRFDYPGQGLLYFWNISTGVDTFSTKKGYYRPIAFSSRHWSNKYDAAMLSSVFFDGGKALHSSITAKDLKRLGKRRTSHGCVHVEDHRAEELFHLIGQSGYGLVENIDKAGNLIRNANGTPQKIKSYKTLIIIH